MPKDFLEKKTMKSSRWPEKVKDLMMADLFEGNQTRPEKKSLPKLQESSPSSVDMATWLVSDRHSFLGGYLFSTDKSQRKSFRSNYAKLASLLILLIVLFGIVGAYVYFIILPTKGEAYHPAIIPWIEEETFCLKTGRMWYEDHCWDAEHSPYW